MLVERHPVFRINQVLTTKQRRNTRETYLEMNLLKFFFKHTQVLDVCNVNVSVVEIEQLEDDNRRTTKQSHKVMSTSDGA